MCPLFGLLEREVRFDEGRKRTPGEQALCFKRKFFGYHKCLQRELLPFPVSWPDFCHGEGGGGCSLYLAWRSAPRCTPCPCPFPPELWRSTQSQRHQSDDVFMKTLPNIKSLVGHHLCRGRPVWSGPRCIQVRAFLERLHCAGHQILQRSTWSMNQLILFNLHVIYQLHMME